MRDPFSIAFIHPDLGIGGAERFVIDAAINLKAAGHRVVLFTAHHDRTRCFEETTNGSIDVRVYGDFLPLHLRQRLRAPCAIVRMCYVALRLAACGEQFDVIFCDLVSHAVLLLRLLTRAKIIFYCHFPDKLMALRRGGWYRWYRAPIDLLEEVITGIAHRILVNSGYTAAAFRRAYPHLSDLAPEVLYPGVNMSRCDGPEGFVNSPDNRIIILSIGRYERSKNARLAIEAISALREHLLPQFFQRIQLIIAGGFDKRLAECHVTLASLRALACERGLERQVAFLMSVSQKELRALVSSCLCVLHTATEEHFGYVPLEAMAAGRPVVVANQGGPAETVLDGVTGYIRPPTAEAFACALNQLIRDPVMAERMGRAGRAYVAEHFSQDAFRLRLESLLEQQLCEGETKRGM